MPHLDSEYIRPLYDVHEGGKPKGFQCQLGSFETSGFCCRVTRTLRGMIAHQRIVHGLRQQGVFDFETIQRTSDSI